MTPFRSLLELLPVLVENAYLLPSHEDFAVLSQKNASSFTPAPNVRCSMRDLVWHKERLNISLRIGIPGTVQLKDQAGLSPEKVGLTRTYPAQIYRMFQLVRDGKYHVSSISVQFDGPESESLKAALKPALHEDGPNRYRLNLEWLPIIANDGRKVDLKKLCLDYREKIHAQAELKMLKYICDDVFSVPEPHIITLGNLQREFLRDNGIDPETGTFSFPTRHSQNSSDGPCLSLEMENAYNLPSAEVIWKKRHLGKPLRVAETVMAAVLDEVDQIMVKVGGSAEQINGYFKPRITQLQRQVRAMNARILEQKFYAYTFGKYPACQRLMLDGDEFLLSSFDSSDAMQQNPPSVS